MGSAALWATHSNSVCFFESATISSALIVPGRRRWPCPHLASAVSRAPGPSASCWGAPRAPARRRSVPRMAGAMGRSGSSAGAGRCLAADVDDELPGRSTSGRARVPGRRPHSEATVRGDRDEQARRRPGSIQREITDCAQTLGAKAAQLEAAADAAGELDADAAAHRGPCRRLGDPRTLDDATGAPNAVAVRLAGPSWSRWRTMRS